MHHGHGGKSPEEDIDTEKFFRFVAKRLMITIPVHLAYHLLAALPEHQNFIR
jgi:hypothetical protein